MSSSKTVSIPARLGSTQLSEAFGKISFTPEVKDMLASLEAELTVRYMTGGERPIIQVLSRTGKSVCTLEEFKALSGYRRFINEALKDTDKVSATNEKVKLISYFLALARVGGNPVPERILEQNMTKFNQLGSSIQLLEKHVEKIDDTVDNQWRTYLRQCAASIKRVLLSCQKACLGSEIVSKTFIEDGLFDARVPKWVYTKFCDKNFTNNLKNDSMTLLFPRNNFLKAVALTTKEINDEDFRKANHPVLQKSEMIVTLAGSDFSKLLPTVSDEQTEAFKTFLEGYQWVCTNPQTASEILTLRQTGKTIPVMRDIQAPRRSGKNQRPESELARTIRQSRNVLDKIQGTWNSMMNFCIPVANPRTEFWGGYFGVDHWKITPTESIYDWIRKEVDGVIQLEVIRSGTDDSTLARVARVTAQVLSIPAATTDAKILLDVFTSKRKSKVYTSGRHPDVSMTYPVGDLDNFNPDAVSTAELDSARKFLGMKGLKAPEKKKTGASAVRLTRDVLNELLPLKDNPVLYDKIVTWLMTTFRTGNRHALQKLAAERILGEALKHQDAIFGDNFEEDEALEEIEGFYSDSE